MCETVRDGQNFNSVRAQVI